MNISKKKIKSGQSRSEIITVRLDPRLRYFVELAARKQRRTISSFIENVAEDSLKSIFLDGPASEQDGHLCLNDESPTLWDPEPADRFILLCINRPELLTFQEQVIWKKILETPKFLKRELNSRDPADSIDDFDVKVIRKSWADLTGTEDK